MPKEARLFIYLIMLGQFPVSAFNMAAADAFCISKPNRSTYNASFGYFSKLFLIGNDVISSNSIVSISITFLFQINNAEWTN